MMNSKITKIIIAISLVGGAALVHTLAGAKRTTSLLAPKGPADDAGMLSAEEELRHEHEHEVEQQANEEDPHGKEEVGAILPEFNFVGQDGGRFLSKSLDDKVWLANFIFTSCESMCPLIAQKIQTLQQRFLGEKEQFKMISFSLDPERDTPLKLKAYGEKYKADMSQWWFLTGNWREIRALMLEGFKVAAPDQPAMHTDRLVLVDKGMKIHSYYSANSPEDFERLSVDIAALLAR